MMEAATKSDTCRNFPAMMYSVTKSDTCRNSPTMMYAATKSDTCMKQKKYKKKSPGTSSCALNGAGPQALDSFPSTPTVKCPDCTPLTDTVKLPVALSIITKDNFGLFNQSLPVRNELPAISNKAKRGHKSHTQSLSRQENTELHHDIQTSPQDHTSYCGVYWNKQMGIWEYDLPPPPPDPTPSYMGGADKAPSSSHPPQHDTVVEESLSRMSTDSQQRSSKVIDEENSRKQPTMSTADTSVITVNMSPANSDMSLATSVYTDPNTTYSRHTDSANNCIVGIQNLQTSQPSTMLGMFGENSP